jgi:hypothetical protein
VFTEVDVKSLTLLGHYLTKYSKFNDLGVDDIIKLRDCFVTYNTILKKVEDHILEIRKVEGPQEHPLDSP